jgi:hypothetical protein
MARRRWRREGLQSLFHAHRTMLKSVRSNEGMNLLSPKWAHHIENQEQET